jgi:hypothetical protein
MSSLFKRKRTFAADLLTLPAYCVPVDEPDTLASKREAQLQWMREKGVNYLGSPMQGLRKRQGHGSRAASLG